MHTPPPTQLLPAPRAPSGRRLVVWDVDGTLTRTDTLVPFLRAVLGPDRWRRCMLTAAADTARRSGGRAYLKDALLRYGLTGLPAGSIERVGQQYAARLLANGCRPDALARYRWHDRRGDIQVLASASLDLYLTPFGRLLGAHHVVCTEVASADGLLTGTRSTPNCRGAEKARRVGAAITGLAPATVWVYSDSRSDAPTFALADVAVHVRPWRRVRAVPDQPPVAPPPKVAAE